MNNGEKEYVNNKNLQGRSDKFKRKTTMFKHELREKRELIQWRRRENK